MSEDPWETAAERGWDGDDPVDQARFALEVNEWLIVYDYLYVTGLAQPGMAIEGLERLYRDYRSVALMEHLL